MKKLKLIIISFMVIVFATAFSPSISNVQATELYDYSQSFTDINKVAEDFDSYFISTTDLREPELISDHWQVDSTNGITRIKDYSNPSESNTDPNLGNVDVPNKTINIASLVLRNKVLADFELNVEMRKNNKGNGFWSSIAFRQATPGKFFIHTSGGAGFFFQDSGVPTIWGSQVGGPYQNNGIALPNIDVSKFIKVRITVQGNEFKLYVDGSSTASFTHTFNDNFYVEGYISLQSVNNSATFRNLTIKELSPVARLPRAIESPIAGSTSEYSLDNMLGNKDGIDRKIFMEV